MIDKAARKLARQLHGGPAALAPKQYLRKRQMAARYSCHERSVERMARDGQVPPPIYLPGSRIPLWEVGELDASDRRAATRPLIAAE